MKIEELTPSDIGVLAPLFSEAHADVPFCPPVDEAEFVRGFAYREFSRSGYAETLLSETVLVAREGGRITGFADIAVTHVVKGGVVGRYGLLRALVFPVGRRPAGEALLAAAKGWAREAGVEIVRAFRNSANYDHGGYRFHHLDFGMLSDRMVHIWALLVLHGFEPSGGEVFFTAPDFEAPPEEPDPAGIRIAVELAPPERAVRPGIHVRAHRDEKEVGLFESCSAAEFSGSPAMEDTGFVTGLNIIPEEQGRRIGLLLHDRGLLEMRRAGFHHAAISTDWRNDRALLFYANHGYRLADTLNEFSRSEDR